MGPDMQDAHGEVSELWSSTARRGTGTSALAAALVLFWHTGVSRTAFSHKPCFDISSVLGEIIPQTAF